MNGEVEGGGGMWMGRELLGMKKKLKKKIGVKKKMCKKFLEVEIFEPHF